MREEIVEAEEKKGKKKGKNKLREEERHREKGGETSVGVVSS